MGIFNKIATGHKNLLFGKPTTPQGQRLPGQLLSVQAEARKQQLAGLESLGSAPAEKIAGQEVERETRGLAGQRDDARRRLQDLMARRGLGTTSVGLGHQAGLEQQFGQQIQEARLSLPERIRQLQLQRLSAAGQVLGQPGTIAGATPARSRQGGILPAILGAAGAGIGGSLGGTQGAGVGGQLGVGTGQSLTQSRI